VTVSDPYTRGSDRWVTPAVVVTGLLVVGVVLLSLIAATAWLTREGVNIDPMLQLMREWVTTVAALGALVLQLANRSSVTKTERNTGQLKAETGALASAMYEVADAMPRVVPPAARHAPHDATAYLEREGAPAARGS
jgi:hypothetical protein